MIETLFWKPFAWFVSRRPIASWMYKRAAKTKYFDLDNYMIRDWIFNGYSDSDNATVKYPSLPSAREHHILRADRGRHPHDHPRDARSIIQDGWYVEKRVVGLDKNNQPIYKTFLRQKGDTFRINFGEYHHISEVSDGGVKTLFIVGPYKGRWGFLVDGQKVFHDEYEEIP